MERLRRQYPEHFRLWDGCEDPEQMYEPKTATDELYDEEVELWQRRLRDADGSERSLVACVFQIAEGAQCEQGPIGPDEVPAWTMGAASSSGDGDWVHVDFNFGDGDAGDQDLDEQELIDELNRFRLSSNQDDQADH